MLNIESTCECETAAYNSCNRLRGLEYIQAFEEVTSHCMLDECPLQTVKLCNSILWIGNQVQGLGKDEAEFLDFVSRRRTEVERQRISENEAVLQEYRVS